MSWRGAGLTEQFAAALSDKRRDLEHSLLSMVRQRIYGVIAGYVERLTANGSTAPERS